MGQLTINVNGHHYTIGCGDGEEERLRSLARELAGRMDALVAEVGQVGDARLLVMLNLLLLDEIEVRVAQWRRQPPTGPARTARPRSWNRWRRASRRLPRGSRTPR